MRHPKEGAALVAIPYILRIPVINAGDGGHQHPTQTLDRPYDDPLPERTDWTIMTIGLCGDLKFGRTVHSLINALVRYTGIRFVLISPEELRLPSYIRDGCTAIRTTFEYRRSRHAWKMHFRSWMSSI